MPLRRLIHILGLLPLLLFGVSCATTATIEGRIERYPEKYAHLPSSHKPLVREGKIKEGMSKDAVYIAWGTPADVRFGGQGGREFEAWRFAGHYPVWSDPFTFGYARYGSGCGRYYDFGPSVTYVPYTRAKVEFLDGKVSRWERSR